MQLLMITQKPKKREKQMRIERIWAMPNKETFTILPIKNLLAEEIKLDEVWEANMIQL